MKTPKKIVSRRQFMNSGLTAATGLAVSSILPAPALATGFPPDNNLLVVGRRLFADDWHPGFDAALQPRNNY
jgi:phospholipase/lecithinase/hemolysin